MLQSEKTCHLGGFFKKWTELTSHQKQKKASSSFLFNSQPFKSHSLDIISVVVAFFSSITAKLSTVKIHTKNFYVNT